MNRKERRTLQKKMGKDTVATIDLMLNPGECCKSCKKIYDKKDREMVKTWFVEVFNKEKKVDLFCPECYKEKNNGSEKNSSV